MFGLVSAVVAAHPAAAIGTGLSARQDIIDQNLEDGTYIGTVHVHGGFTFPLQDLGSALFTSAIDGEAEMQVVDGTVTGSWTYAGTGGGGAEAAGISITSESVYDGAGSFAGTATAPRIVGQNNVTGSATFLGTTSSSSESQAIDEAITNILAGCGQVVGSFSLRVNQEIEAQLPGATSFIDGTVALYTDPPTDEVLELARRASELRAGRFDAPDERIFQAIELLTEVELLQAELNASSSCPASKEYFNILTNVAADMVVEVLAALEERATTEPLDTAELSSQLLPAILRLAVSTGATGSGAVGGRGAELLGRARSVAQASVDELLGSTGSLDGLVRLASLSVQLNWNLEFGEVTDRDVLVTIGDGS